ncbi:site-specific integrase [Pseudohalioglobus sediminis]|uniref:Site-specific integrase n=1 Tax=Pseudohalioglobus sediminis TaxID=2606449 RepID=A0A5B0WSH9_9GAMM|nr:site-specific integrase [Pseudohalioglobus sediminis]KAA1189255.1 site-specific integrase [Pseudohalioglobus sediminis]
MATFRKRSGRWQAMIRRTGHPQLTKTFNSKADAAKWARQMETQIERQLHLPSHSQAQMPLSELLDRYCAEHLPRLQGHVSEGYRLQHLREQLGHLKLAEVQSHALSAYRDRRLAEVSPASVKREVALVLRVLRIAALEWNITLPAGIPAVRLPKVANARSRRVTDNEIAELTSHTASPIAAKAIQFALATGMRRGEIVRAKWSDINLAERTIHIPRTKTDIPRHIPITERAMKVIQKADSQGGDLLFPIEPNSLSQAFRRACKRADIKDLHFHDLRHEAITRFFELGLSIPEVASVSGHRDYRMLERYTHISKKHLSERIEQLSRI